MEICSSKPVKEDGVSSVKEDGVSSVKEDGVSPVKEDGVSSVKEDGVSSVKEDGVSPVKEDGVSSVKEDGVSSVKEDGVSPVKEDGVSSVKEDGVSSVKEDGANGLDLSPMLESLETVNDKGDRAPSGMTSKHQPDVEISRATSSKDDGRAKTDVATFVNELKSKLDTTDHATIMLHVRNLVGKKQACSWLHRLSSR